MQVVIRFQAGVHLVWWAAFLSVCAYAAPVLPEAGSHRDVSAYITVIEIKQKSVKIRHGKRVRFKVTAEITLKNTSQKAILSPIRSIVNIVGAGCADKVWTRAFSKVQACEISQVRQLERLDPGESTSFSVEFEKPLNIEITYEVLTYGILETEDHAGKF